MNRVKLAVAVLMLSVVVHGQEGSGNPSSNRSGSTSEAETQRAESSRTVLKLPNSPQPQEDTQDDTKVLGLIGGFSSGSGWDANGDPTAQADLKLGLGFLTTDLAFDRSWHHNGFSIEESGVVPLIRLPFRSKTVNTNFLRVYAEPGVGHRWGGKAATGGYSSAKMMFVLFSNRRINGGGWSPFIEVQHRFPFDDPTRGDNRISIGLISATGGHGEL